MKKVFTLALLMTISLFGFSQTVDQSQTERNNIMQIFFSVPDSAFQSFTAGLSGQLSSVDLSLQAFVPGNVTVDIYSGAIEDANLGASPLGSNTVFVSSGGIVTFNFSGVNVTANQKYSIKINGAANIGFDGRLNDNLYPGGQSYFNGGPNATADAYFVTTVIVNTTPDLSSLCGTTLDANPGLVRVNKITGATRYSFYFIENDAVWSQENRAQRALDLSTVDAPDLLPGRTYSVLVKAFGEGLDTTLLAGCDITTYAPTTTQLVSGDCGKVMTTNEVLTADPVSGADRYQFVFYASGQQSIIKESSDRIYNFPFYAKNFAKGIEYNVNVASRVNGVWSDLGPTCTFTTPGADAGVISNCGTNYTSWNQNVNAEIQSGAQKYHFLFNNAGVQTSYYTSKPYVKLKNVNGLVGDTDYSIRVRVQKNGVYGEVSTASCTINTPSGSPSRTAEFAEADVEIFMYPNPASSDVVYFSSAINNVSVFDVHGSLVKSELNAVSLDISDLTPGMYMVKSDEGLAKLIIK